MITRAVLLAAGRGARLGELTRRFPKAMLQVGGQPILHRIIAALASEGVSEITIVTGHEAAALERATGAGETWGTRIRYRRQRELNGTAGAVTLARDHLGDAPFFCGWGDIVVEAANYGRVLSAASGGDGALAINEVDDPAAGAAVYVDDRGCVTRIVEKPAPGTSGTHWNNAGLAVLPAAIWKYIDVLEVSPRGELELPQAIAAFVAEGGRLKAVPIQGKWFDVGTPENFEAARRHFGV